MSPAACYRGGNEFFEAGSELLCCAAPTNRYGGFNNLP